MRQLEGSGGLESLPDVHLLRGHLPLDPKAFDGIDPVFRDGHAVVGEVAPGSPAALSGIQAGDALLAIDGADVSLLGPEAVNLLLAGDPGRTVSVTFARGGTARTATFQLAPVAQTR